MKKRYYILFSTLLTLNLVACKKQSTNEINVSDAIKPTQNVASEETNLDLNDKGIDAAKALEENEAVYEFIYDDNYWEIYDMSHALYKTKADFENDVLKYIDEISTLLKCEDWFTQYGKDKMYIKLKVNNSIYQGHSMPPSDYTMNSSIMVLSFNTQSFQSQMPLVHELTHIITYKKSTNKSSFSASLIEGICDYTSYCFNNSMTTASIGFDKSTYLLFLKNKYQQDNIITDQDFNDVIATIGTSVNGYPFDLPTPKGYLWMVCSDSFTEYMIHTYGLEDVITIFNAADETIYDSFHEKGLEGIIDEWLDYLDKYIWVMSEDEIIEQLNQSHMVLPSNK